MIELLPFIMTMIQFFLNLGQMHIAIPLIIVAILIIVFFKVRGKVNLKNHQIFLNLKQYRYNNVLCLTDSNKCKAIKRFLNVYIDHLTKWLDEDIASDNKWDTKEVLKSYQTTISSIEHAWIVDQAPILFIEKWRTYSKQSDQMIQKYIMQTTESDFYTTDHDKKLLILTVAQVIFFATLKDIDIIVSSLNGELDAYFGDKK